MTIGVKKANRSGSKITAQSRPHHEREAKSNLHRDPLRQIRPHREPLRQIRPHRDPLRQIRPVISSVGDERNRRKKITSENPKRRRRADDLSRGGGSTKRKLPKIGSLIRKSSEEGREKVTNGRRNVDGKVTDDDGNKIGKVEIENTAKLNPGTKLCLNGSTNDPVVFKEQKMSILSTCRCGPRRLKVFFTNSVMTLFLAAVTVLVRPLECQTVPYCPQRCSCETLTPPTTSNIQHIWPSVLTNSLLPERLSVPPTENLVLDLGGENRGEKHLRPSSVSQFPSVNEGEIAVDCSDRKVANLSSLLRDLHSQDLRLIVKLDFSSNFLERLHKSELEDFSNLRFLSFRGNRLYEIAKSAFAGLEQLQILDLADNLLPKVPTAIQTCRALHQILLSGNQITYVDEQSFYGLDELQWVDLQRNPLLDVHPLAFVGLSSLVKLILESARDLSQIPSVDGSWNIESIRIDRGSLASVPQDLCRSLPYLRSLNLHLNNIDRLPEMKFCYTLRLLDLSSNRISSLGHGSFEGAAALHDLLLQYNFIEHIPDDAFVGLSELQVLNLEHNKITVIEPSAFRPLVSLEDINLGNNEFPEIPSTGLESVVLLKAHNNRHLRIFPGAESFPSVHSLTLSYAYHCCPFLSDTDSDDVETSTAIQEEVVFSADELQKYDPEIWNHSNVWPHIEGIPTSEFRKVWEKKELNATASSATSRTIALLRIQEGNVTKFIPLNGTRPPKKSPNVIQCIPQPGPFMPCRDLFDWWTLRCGVWLVFLLALMGNGIVVIVLVTAYSKMDVPRFLVANLALADFFMGVYLGFLAVVDASTLGDFRMYAIQWQMSAGCQLAGFLGVLSSELSVYTLTVITLERNYAIIHAMHLNKRLSLKHAAYIMAVGWVFALTMAVLPLGGVSDYRKFAVCLPFETDGAGLGYIVFLMFVNGIAFIILMGCYLKIYCAIKGSQAWNSNDSRIAKRMALLVFTDFICWAPIAFFSLSASFGLQLISLEGAKVFTVFVLPLNSCCNPFLYALLTKQFKKDCVMLCKAIEESRVTRGIGRCRHSSNFSNRQTPANTNSALEQLSKEEHFGCDCRLKEHNGNTVAARALRFLYGKTGGVKTPGAARKSAAMLNRSPLKTERLTTLESSSKINSSWSWKGQTVSNLRLLELRRQSALELARKPSQESSLSSSRNDSSGTSGSTVTWRISRSSVSSDTSSGGTKGPHSGSMKDKNHSDGDPNIEIAGNSGLHPKPRLQKQRAIDVGTSFSNELRCPLHSRGENLSCVYEQSSLEEENSNEVFEPPVKPICYSHKRSLSDGLLCGTLLSLSAPTPELVTSMAPNLRLSRQMSIPRSALAHGIACSDSLEQGADYNSDNIPLAEGFLSIQPPVNCEETSELLNVKDVLMIHDDCEEDPLLHKPNI